jgi:hypothetical protein
MDTDDAYIGRTYHDGIDGDYFKCFAGDEPGILETYGSDTVDEARNAPRPDGGWVEIEQLRERLTAHTFEDVT